MVGCFYQGSAFANGFQVNIKCDICKLRSLSILIKKLTMKTQLIKNFLTTGGLIVLSGLLLCGYSQSIRLQYKYPAGRAIKYVTDTKIVQDMDVNGQSMLVNIGRYMGCEVKAAGSIAQNIKLEIKIDSIEQNVESPQGTAGGNITEVKGKSFNIVITPAGKVVDLSEASKIVYTIEGSGEASLGNEFLNFFPSLPDKEMKLGDTWVSNDTLDSKTDNNTVWMPVESTFKFEGIDNINGVDCAKLTATLSGSRKMTTQAQGMEIHTSGPFTGTETLVFAIKEGYFVKESVSTKMTGNLEIPDQNMSFPVVMTVNSTNEIVK